MSSKKKKNNNSGNNNKSQNNTNNTNKGKKNNSKQQSFFEKSKKQIFIFGGIAVALIITLIIVLAAGGGSAKTDGAFKTPDSILQSSLTFSKDELYEGYFESDTQDVTILCVSGTDGCYAIESDTITFSGISEDSVYSISGQFKGNIVIDIADDYKFDLEMHGFTLVSESVNPITVLGGNEVSLTAKNGYKNYIYDMRDAIDESDETLYSGAIHSVVDLEIGGKGSMVLVSENNNGIHSKDDLQVKNLSLKILCVDNALKGNDSVSLENCTTELIATQGDGIKTTNTDISEKGTQRGTVTITGGIHTIGAACDGIDAAYNVVIEDEATVLNIYTDKYSSASEEVTATSDNTYYLRSTSKSYKFSIKYFNSDDDFEWINIDSSSYKTVTSQSTRPGASGTTYYYYSFEKKSEYDKLVVYAYKSTQDQGQDEDYYACSSSKTLNDNYDTLAVSVGSSSVNTSWTNYTTSSSSGGGMMGGMNGGNSDKGDYSTKGLKAGNEITINAGTVNIKAYDDAIHANKDSALENGSSPTGNVTVNGGTVTVYSNDDGIHADGTLLLNGGTVTVENSYEGLEGTNVIISDGSVWILSSDDGINGTATSGTAIEISGGSVYIYCTGDGIDSNSGSSNTGIVFSGGNTVVISNSSSNSAIDTENGYKYSGGTVVAIMPRGGMAYEAVDCSNFSSIGKYTTMSLTKGKVLTAKIDGATITVEMPCSISGYVIVLGDKSASVSVN